jgi:hypothetical protein
VFLAAVRLIDLRVCVFVPGRVETRFSTAASASRRIGT